MANRYFVNGGINNNWSDSSNWSLTSGGVGGQAVPTSVDDVFLDANSPNCIINAGSIRQCSNFNCTGYTNTLTHSVTLQISGDTTLSAAMTFVTTSVTSLFQIIGSSSIRSNGKTIPCTFRIASAASINVTLLDNLTVQHFTYTANNNISCNLNGPGLQLIVLGNIDFGTGTFTGLTLGGTATVLHSGTGTWTTTASSGFSCNFTVDVGSTLTLATTTYLKGGTVTNNGTLITTGTTLTIASANISLNLSSTTFNNITINGTSTVTLLSDLNLSGLLLLGSSTNITTINGFNINASGSYTCASDTTGRVSGTTVLNMIGNGNITNSGTTTGSTTLDININTTGLIYLINDFYYNKGTFKVLTPNSFIPLSGSSFRVTSALAATTVIDGSIRFAGLRIASGGAIVSLTSDVVITQIIGSSATAAQPSSFISNSVGVQRKMTVLQGATVDVAFTNTVDIDSGDGKTVYSYRGTSFSNTINWAVLPTEPVTKNTIFR